MVGWNFLNSREGNDLSGRKKQSTLGHVFKHNEETVKGSVMFSLVA